MRDRAERRADRLRLADAGGALVDLVGASSAAPARSVSPGSITPALPETRRQFAAWGRGELDPGCGKGVVADHERADVVESAAAAVEQEDVPGGMGGPQGEADHRRTE